MSNYVWGVDSAVNVTEDLLKCVRRYYGSPDFWGRYLTRVEGASEGLTKEEILYLKNNGIKVMPIYNAFREAVGRRNGAVAANNAIFSAKRLGIYKGVVLFANIERFFTVDASWLIGYVESMYRSDYRPGFYHDPTEGGFNQSYCQAVKESDLVKSQSILWSAEPEVGVSSKGNAPRFRPQKPACQAVVWAWQYGRDANECPIDTVLADSKLYNLMH